MTLTLPVINRELFDPVATWFTRIPHSQVLGIQVVHGERGRATLMLPYKPELVGNRKTGVLHGGVITSLIDNASGLSIYSLLEQAEAIATLDLRIDYLRPATPGLPVYCMAECYRLSRQIAFTRATAYQDDNSQPVAYSVGTFMRGANSGVITGDGNAEKHGGNQ
ncbi:MAG: PaaI family thioesterase [Pedobacter sp.]|nr:PaaI family thioesterase [Pedobacter sp.]